MQKTVIVIALLLLLAGNASVGQQRQYDSSDRMTICVQPAERERIREVVLLGIDRALRDHVIKLFDIWMKDDHLQPKRAIEGMEIGISAYMRARSNAVSWKPPPCDEEKK